jgi:hypothetical protein
MTHTKNDEILLLSRDLDACVKANSTPKIIQRPQEPW